MLDESPEILTAAWPGEPVHHRSEHHTVDSAYGLGERHTTETHLIPIALQVAAGTRESGVI